VISPLGLSVFLALVGLHTLGVPAFDEVRQSWRPSDVLILDRHGEPVHEIRVDPHVRRLAWTPLSDVSPTLRHAIVRTEDRTFYRHHGVDWQALAGAALRSVIGGPRRGASTITMQVAAMIDPSLGPRGGSRTLAQKWRQLWAARALERRWSKAEILEAYLNLTTFRGELTGVGAAAAVLFDKAPHGLTAAESGTIAALVRAPGAARSTVLRRARALAAGADAAGIEDAVARALGAPHGTGPRLGLAPHVAARLVRRGATPESFTVRTTLDASVQRLALDVMRRQVLAVRDRHVQDGAALVVDNASGDVLAYVGSVGELSVARWVDGVHAYRQPGSALKPFLYGLAFDVRLLTPATILEDVPLEVPTPRGLYRPHNYDEQFRGRVSARTALAASLNVPAVRVLELIGEDAFAERLRALDFDRVREPGDFFGPGLALGSADVSLWELAAAYRALAEGGVWRPLHLSATDGAGESRRVYSTAAAFLVSQILADRESRSTTFGLENALATPFWTAVKTGTSKDMRDNWCVGYSTRYTVAVWVGNFSGEPMRQVSGVTGAAPAWLELMSLLHDRVPSREPEAPPDARRAIVASSPGGDTARTEWFVDGTQPVLAMTDTASPRPRIASPVSGTVIAIDPDIPAASQRVTFESRGTDRLVWRLDGVVLGPSAGRVLWRPEPGRHVLQLVDDAERVRDAVTFQVRGGVALR
jgi:penicillin-binding protein 1C